MLCSEKKWALGLIQKFFCASVLMVCVSGVNAAIAFDDQGAKAAIDKLDGMVKQLAIDLSKPQRALNNLQSKLAAVSASQYLTKSPVLQQALMDGQAAYQKQLSDFNAIKAKAPTAEDIDSLTTMFNERNKQVTDYATDTLKSDLVQVQNAAEASVKEITNKVNEALAALEAARAFFNTISAPSAGSGVSAGPLAIQPVQQPLVQ